MLQEGNQWASRLLEARQARGLLDWDLEGGSQQGAGSSRRHEEGALSPCLPAELQSQLCSTAEIEARREELAAEGCIARFKAAAGSHPAEPPAGKNTCGPPESVDDRSRSAGTTPTQPAAEQGAGAPQEAGSTQKGAAAAPQPPSQDADTGDAREVLEELLGAACQEERLGEPYPAGGSIAPGSALPEAAQCATDVTIDTAREPCSTPGPSLQCQEPPQQHLCTSSIGAEAPPDVPDSPHALAPAAPSPATHAGAEPAPAGSELAPSSAPVAAEAPGLADLTEKQRQEEGPATCPAATEQQQQHGEAPAPHAAPSEQQQQEEEGECYPSLALGGVAAPTQLDEYGEPLLRLVIDTQTQDSQPPRPARRQLEDTAATKPPSRLAGASAAGRQTAEDDGAAEGAAADAQPQEQQQPRAATASQVAWEAIMSAEPDQAATPAAAAGTAAAPSTEWRPSKAASAQPPAACALPNERAATPGPAPQPSRFAGSSDRGLRLRPEWRHRPVAFELSPESPTPVRPGMALQHAARSPQEQHHDSASHISATEDQAEGHAPPQQQQVEPIQEAEILAAALGGSACTCVPDSHPQSAEKAPAARESDIQAAGKRRASHGADTAPQPSPAAQQQQQRHKRRRLSAGMGQVPAGPSSVPPVGAVPAAAQERHAEAAPAQKAAPVKSLSARKGPKSNPR